MNRKMHVGIGVLLGCLLGFPAYGQENRYIIDVGTAITMGKFTYDDATVDISEEVFNPRFSVEYVFSENDNFSFGLAYARSKNTFGLDYEDSKKHLDGTLDVKRSEYLPFIRFGARESINVRLGYRMFKYTFSGGELDETRGRELTKQIREGWAKGKLSNGLDAELNLFFGESLQLGAMIGCSYFFNARYSWSYRDLLKDGAVNTGTAKLDTVSLRIAPGVTYLVAENWRVFASYLIEATSWLGSKDDEDEEYAGTDIMSALMLGVRYTF